MDYNRITNLLLSEVTPALGCTAPIAVALAAARCKDEITEIPKRISVVLDPGIYKNGWGVSIPGTREKGNDLGAALGSLAGDSTAGLNVLKNITNSDIEKALNMIRSKIVSVKCDTNKTGIYISVTINTNNETVHTLIKDTHSKIALVEVNGKIIFELPNHGTSDANISKKEALVLQINEIFDYIKKVPLDKIDFLNEGIKMNMLLAKDGLNKNFGLGSAQALLKEYGKDTFKNNLIMRSRILTCAASDARMGGSLLPAMSTVGSGNQGITAIIPVAVYADLFNISKEKLTRALALSHLITYYVKQYVGRISSTCLCAVASSAGATAGIAYMQDADDSVICDAINNVISSLAGMICDGAKDSCALKMGVAASEAIISSTLALNSSHVDIYDGISENILEDTLKNLGSVTMATKDLIDLTMVDILNNKTSL